MNLTDEQIKAINEIDNNLQIIACAGSGKTEVITRRIAKILNKGINVSDIIAFTFTEKASLSMKNRIKKVVNNLDINDMYVGTIHGFCYKIIKEKCPEFLDFKILDTVKNYLFVKRYFDKCGMSDLGLTCNSLNIKLFLNCIDKLVYDYDNYELWSDLDKIVFNKYRKCLYEKKYLDFSLLIFEAVRELKKNNKILSNIKYLIIDEYQDVDDLREQIIEIFNQVGCNICVVGDDDQTIYRFRGSNADNMINFSKKYPNVTKVKLEKNFRCSPGIVDIADCVIMNNKNRLDKKMVSGVSSFNGVIDVKGYDNEDDEYLGIAHNIIKLNKMGINYNDIAILVRKGKYINKVTKVLNDNNIPYISDSSEYFFENKYFVLLMNTLELLTNFSKSGLYELWKDNVNQVKFNVGFKFLRQVVSNSNTSNLVDILSDFANIIGFLDEEYDDLELRKDVLDGILDILSDYEEIYNDYQLTAKINGILHFLKNEANEQYKYHNFKSSNLSDGVEILTVHKAKGLEYNTIFLPNLVNTSFPIRNVGGKKYWHVLSERFKQISEKFEGDIEDERKLFYVAVTRAKENLFFSYHLSKNEISEFLVEASISQYLKIDKY